MLLEPVAVLGCYLIGAIPFGLLLGRLIAGIDLREHGSGNLGATNALRVLGWKLGATVLLLDMLKGAGPLWLLQKWHPKLGLLLPLAGLAAILGHVFPVYLGFRGGKGVATSGGVFLVLNPPATGLAIASFALVVAVTRYVSLGSLVAASVLGISPFVVQGWRVALGEGLPTTTMFILTTAIVFGRHLGNIKRLVGGTESKLGAKSQPEEVLEDREIGA